jgi:energy-converting hydrogenase B subunit D
MFWALDYLALALVLAAAVTVVRLRNLSGAVMALSATGVLLGLLFVVLGAPDDAHAEIVVGTIALPTLYLIAIGKVRTVVADESDLGEPGDRPAPHHDEGAEP